MIFPKGIMRIVIVGSVLVLCGFAPVPGMAAAVHDGSDQPLIFENFEQASSDTQEYAPARRSDDAKSESLKVTLLKGNPAGVVYNYPKGYDGSRAQALVIRIWSEAVAGIVFRIVSRDENGKTASYRRRAMIAKGENLFQFEMSLLKGAVDTEHFFKIWIYSDKFDAGAVFWIDAIYFGDMKKGLTMTKGQWDLNPDHTIPSPFDPPNPDVVLWHRYDEKWGVEDVLDWSKHGSIGEFTNCDRLLVGDPETESYNLGIRLYGEFKRNTCLGYRIMASDQLTLKEGTISFWAIVDPVIKTKKGIVFADGRNGKRKYIGIANGKKGVVLTVSMGKRKLEVKDLPANEWFHVAWTFDASSQDVYIDGKLAGSLKQGASLNGGHGFFVGHDGSRFAKTHSGGGGFAGMLDELRIYPKKRTDFPGMKYKPSDKAPKMGLLLWYDFQDSTATDKAGMGLDGTDMYIVEKGVSGWTKWQADDKAWKMDCKGNNKDMGSLVKTPLNPMLNLTNGTLEFRFQVLSLHQYNWYWYLLSSNNNDADRHPRVNIKLRMGGEGGKREWMTLEFQDIKTKEKLYIKQWEKLVFVWHWVDGDPLGSWVKIWLNDKFLGKFQGQKFRMWGKRGALRVGQNRDTVNHSEGTHMLATDLKIYNYARSVYVSDE